MKKNLCGVIIQHTIAGPITCANKKPCWIHDKETMKKEIKIKDVLNRELELKNNPQESWEERYCKKFGLCREDRFGEKCQCKEELKFISSLLKQEKEKWEEKVKRHSDNFVSKYPVKTIGQHHYIRKRDLGYYLEEQKEKWENELRDKIEGIKPARDETMSFKLGVNKAVEDIKKIIKEICGI